MIPANLPPLLETMKRHAGDEDLVVSPRTSARWVAPGWGGTRV
jgi:hypothetical protein